MADDDAPTGTLFDARALYASLLAMGRATVALQTARDQLIASTGNSMAGAVAHILFDAALGLTNQLGEQFAALAHAPADPETRAWVVDVLEGLHAERAPETVPPDPGPEAPR